MGGALGWALGRGACQGVNRQSGVGGAWQWGSIRGQGEGGYERQARGKLFADVPAPLASGISYSIRKESGKAHTAHTLLRAGTRNPYRNHAWRAPWQLSSPRKIYVRSTDVCGW